jgi:hypothetical protein
MKNKLMPSIFASVLFGFTALFFGPSFIYFNNVLEFNYQYPIIWLYLFAIAFFISILATIITLIFKSIAYEKIVVLFFTLGFLIWLQGNIFVWNYGLLDGREIIWNNYIIYGIIDIITWLVVLIISFIKSKIIFKYIKKASLVLLIIQIVSLGIVAYTAPSISNSKITNKDDFNFSKNKNVIIIVLDSFQSDVFYEIIADKEYQDIFDGFTYYRNATGGFTSTYPSIPLILSGQFYDNSITIKDFKDQIYSKYSLSVLLKQNGFDVGTNTDLVSFPQQKNSTDPNDIQSLIKEKQRTITNILNITFFRYSPQVIKKHFYALIINNMKKEYSQDDLDFINEIISNAEKSNENNVFKFYHLNGAHPPFRLDENLNSVELEQNREGYIAQSKAALKMVGIFLQKLKDINAYDNSIIYIVGDHGSPRGSFGLNLSLIENGFYDDNNNMIPKGIVANGIPLVLFKSIKNQGDLAISDAPVSLSDVPITIASELGIDNNFPGISMCCINDETKRDRRFLYYIWEHEYWGKEYLPEMNEYVISGFSWLSKSWRPAYKKYSPNGVVDTSPEAIKPGQVFNLGKGKTGNQYLLYGWSNPEAGLIWSQGNLSTLFIPVDTKGEIKFSIYAFPYLASGKIKEQKVNVIIDNQVIGEWVFNTNEAVEKSVIIPENFIKDQNLIVTFELPYAASPLEMNESNDSRKLAIALKSLSIEEVEKYNYGSTINFGIEGNYNKFQASGWHAPENGFNWSSDTASLTIPIEKTDSDLELIVKLIQNLQPGKKVDIMVNGKKAGEWLFGENNIEEAAITIENSLLDDDFLNITFIITGAKSPKDMGINEDQRILGIGVKSLVINEVVNN